MSRAKITADAAIAAPTPTIEIVKAESTALPKAVWPSEIASRRTAILDALAAKVARNERLPRRVTIFDEEISTADFLAGFKFDRQNADTAALQRVAPQAIPNATVCEVAAVIGFYLESQIAKAEAARAGINRATAVKQTANQN